jgi:hypothetical protein
MTDFAATRADLQRVATHVLARRRHAVSGRFGLRATPGGFGTPAFGPPDAVEVVRVAGAVLVHEVGSEVSSVPLIGASLGDLAAHVGVDLAADFDVGHDTPALGAVDVALSVDAAHATSIGAWFDLGWRALDAVVASAARPSTVQLWPEHFDAGCSVAVGPGAEDRCNLGASPGDASSDEPYLYVGPWGSERPGSPGYWNAPFGAVLRRAEVPSLEAAVAFLRQGLDRLTPA